MMPAQCSMPSPNHSSSPDWNCLSPIQGLIEDEQRFHTLPESPSPQPAFQQCSLHANNWVHALLSYGGEFASMSSKFFYKGGKTKLLRIDQAITFSKLLVKVSDITSLLLSGIEMRYRYPGLEILEAPLISVEDDHDIQEMIHLFLSLTGQPPPIQLFVFAVIEPSITIAAPSNYVRQTEDGNTELTKEGLGDYPQEKRNCTEAPTMPNDLSRMDLNVPHEGNDNNELMDNIFGLEVGQEFADIKSFKDALREHAIRSCFQFKSIRTDPRRFTAKCADKGCPWRIHASKGDGKSTFKIKSLQAFHTCRRMSRSSGHRQATRRWIAERIKARMVKDRRYSPNEIVEEMRTVHGISVSYTKAWRGRELALKLIQCEESGMDVQN